MKRFFSLLLLVGLIFQATIVFAQTDEGETAVSHPTPVTDSQPDYHHNPDTPQQRQPHRLIDVGGYRLHLYCTGHGGPTVILDAGLGDSSLIWNDIQNEVDNDTRVCSFDRAGLGLSDPSPEPRTSIQFAAELHTLLDRSGEEGPFVLVGHSLGGYNMQLFATLYPEMVQSILLVDASHGNQVAAFSAILPNFEDLLASNTQALGQLADLAAAGTLTQEDIEPLLHPELSSRVKNQTIRLLLNRPQFLATIHDESAAIVESLSQLDQTATIGDTPVIALVATSFPAEAYGSEELANAFRDTWTNLQQDRIDTFTTNGQIQFVENSGHYIQLEQPQAVLDAIAQLITTK